jgi:hypothetical protein
MIAECRSRSDQGWTEGEGWASIAIGLGFS